MAAAFRKRTFRGDSRNNDPALHYVDVDLTTDDFTPPGGGVFRAVFISVAGNLKTTDAHGNTVTWPSTLGTGIFPIGGVKIFKSGTTATGLKAILENDA